MTAYTTNFQLPYLTVGQPARDTRAVLQEIATKVDAALTAGPASPPAAQDLTAVAGRVSVLEAARPSMRRYFTGANIAITNATVTVVGLNVNDWLRGNPNMSAAAPSSNTAPVAPSGSTAWGIKVAEAGLYLVNAEVTWATAGTTGERNAILRLNGSIKRQGGSPSATNARLAPSWPLVLAANDVLDLAVYASGGTGGTLSAGDQNLGLTVTRIG